MPNFNKIFLLLNWISGREEINDFKSGKMAGKGRVKGKPKNIHFQVSFSVTYASAMWLNSFVVVRSGTQEKSF